MLGSLSFHVETNISEHRAEKQPHLKADWKPSMYHPSKVKGRPREKQTLNISILCKSKCRIFPQQWDTRGELAQMFHRCLISPCLPGWHLKTFTASPSAACCHSLVEGPASAPPDTCSVWLYSKTQLNYSKKSRHNSAECQVRQHCLHTLFGRRGPWSFRSQLCFCLPFGLGKRTVLLSAWLRE